MDPKACLDRAQNALDSFDRAKCRAALRDYWQWRNRGGFEPESGDARAHAIARDLRKMRLLRFPSIVDVASALRDVNDFVDDDCDVRLQVYPDGQWAVRFGLSDYDQDHHGYWGASSVPGKRFNSKDIARELLEQAKEAYFEDLSANAE